MRLEWSLILALPPNRGCFRMHVPAVSRLSRGGPLQLIQGRHFTAPSQLARAEQKQNVSLVVPQPTQSSAVSQGASEPLASSFIQPLQISGIRRAPRTPTLPPDSKFIRYASLTGDRLFPFVLTATFLIPLGICVKYF
ncbi:hypothetical protein Esti_001381 [Eimeria stiedai]